jgi:hypothetical protein
MKRILIACVAVVFGASVLPAASPVVDAAIKTIQSVGAAKMNVFCDLEKALEAIDEKEDPAVQKQIVDLFAQLGTDFSVAWQVGEGLDENSADSKEFNAAVDALAEKCP